MAVSNPTKGTKVSSGIFTEWENALKDWAENLPYNIQTASVGETPVASADAMTSAQLKAVVSHVGITSGEQITEQKITDIASGLFSKLANDKILNKNSADTSALFGDLPTENNKIIYKVVGKGKVMTAGEAIVAIPSTINNITSIVKCYN